MVALQRLLEPYGICEVSFHLLLYVITCNVLVLINKSGKTKTKA